jgi:tetratricopeptide (TPR) repeat protein
MTVSELIQQQRHILHALHNAVRQYQQQIAQAQERLERTLEQIQADKAAAEQEAKREYEQARDKYITAVLDAELPTSGVKEEHRASREQAREKLRAQMLSEIEKNEHITVKADFESSDMSSIKEQIREIGRISKKSVDSQSPLGATLLGIGFWIFVGLLIRLVFFSPESNPMPATWFILPILLTATGIYINSKRRKAALAKRSHCIEQLSYSYRNWLKLIIQRSEMQSLEAQQAYQQALEQAKQELSNNTHQLRSNVLDYTTLADRTSPPWHSETWQNWGPGTLMPGVVRLGVFTLQMDQIDAKSAII